MDKEELAIASKLTLAGLFLGIGLLLIALAVPLEVAGFLDISLALTFGFFASWTVALFVGFRAFESQVVEL